MLEVYDVFYMSIFKDMFWNIAKKRKLKYIIEEKILEYLSSTDNCINLLLKNIVFDTGAMNMDYSHDMLSYIII